MLLAPPTRLSKTSGMHELPKTVEMYIFIFSRERREERKEFEIE